MPQPATVMASSSRITSTAHKNCVFDVMATGNTGFGGSYVVSQGSQGEKFKIKLSANDAAQ